MKKGYLTALVTLSLFLGGREVLAAETASANLPSYTLPGIVVTAHRYSKKDVDTPASTNVITKEEIKDTGAVNAQEVLRTVSGLVSETSRQGGGAVNPFSNSEVVIRGIAGTLVLINGTPLNLNNRYELNDIPAGDIERIEVVKGGGSVLYGSEAIGGVINIITKKTRENSVYTGWGNQGRQNHGLSVQAGKLGVGYDYSKFGGLDHNSDYDGKYNNTGDAENQNFNASYQFNKAWRLNLSHDNEHQTTNYMSSSDILLNHRAFDTRKDFIQLLYDDHIYRGSLYYNYADIGYKNDTYKYSKGKTSITSSYKLEKNRVYGGDLQRIWNSTKAGKFLLGVDFKHEQFLPNTNEDSSFDYSRNIYSLFGQWDKNLDKQNNLTLSSRGTWSANAPSDRNYHNLSSQVQFLHKLDKNQSLYASVGQSFKMPTFKQIFGTTAVSDGVVEGNPDVKPQKGIHYEMGWKQQVGNHIWKAAIFDYYIEDNISTDYVKNKDNTYNYKYTNEDLKNMGIELSCSIGKGQGWNYNYGLVYQNPMVKDNENSNWAHKYGKVQLTGGVNYVRDKWRASLEATYLADRYMFSSASQETTKPYLLTSLNINYAMDKHQELNLAVDNLLDRKDNISNTGTYYYRAPINFLLSYKYKF